MKSNVKALEGELTQHLNRAKEISASADGRAFEDDEQKELDTELKAARGIKARIVTLRDRKDLDDSIDEIGEGLAPAKSVEGSGKPSFKSLGEAFVKSDSYQNLLKRGFHGKWTSGPQEFPAEFKATVSEAASPIIQPQLHPGILPVLFQAPTVASLMTPGTTDSNMVRYLKETTATNAADAVTPGDPKPESTLIFAEVDESVRKIATFLPVMDEMLEDVSQLESYLNGRLALFIQLKEDHQLLNGNGTPPQLSGLLDRAGIQEQDEATDTSLDAIYKAITKVRVVSFLEPDGLVIHPNDWSDIRLSKDGNDRYFGGGPFGQLEQDRLWGLRVVVTSAIAEGTALVGAFRAASQLFRRGGMTLEASNSHADFFQENKTAIRAEERVALAVYREAAFCKVTNLG